MGVGVGVGVVVTLQVHQLKRSHSLRPHVPLSLPTLQALPAVLPLQDESVIIPLGHSGDDDPGVGVAVGRVLVGVGVRV